MQSSRRAKHVCVALVTLCESERETLESTEIREQLKDEIRDGDEAKQIRSYQCDNDVIHCAHPGTAARSTGGEKKKNVPSDDASETAGHRLDDEGQEQDDIQRFRKQVFQ